MSNRSRILALVMVLMLALAAGWEIASPWLTIKGMRDAARARDSEALASYIDFPKLRANVRNELVEAIAARTPARGLAAWAAGKLGVGPIIGPIVDVIVSPAALRVALLATPPNNSSLQGRATSRKCGIDRDGLRHFRLRCAQLPGGEGELIFERRGLGWVLVGIDLPKDYGTAVR